MSTVSRLTAERNAKALHELAVLPGNDKCADCKSRNPRWASHNLGIFICVNCASIHRKIGTHVSKVKSLTLDSWNKEQVENMRNIGNMKSNQRYNPDEVRNPPPTNMVDAERDSELEKFIRDKYEFKRFINKSAVVQQYLGPSRSATSVRETPARAATAPLSARPLGSPPTSAPVATTSFSSQQPPLPNRTPAFNPIPTPQRSVTQPVTSATHQAAVASSYAPTHPTGGVWNDLLALQNPQSQTINATLPLQIASNPTPSMVIPNQQPGLGATPYYGTGSSSNYAMGQVNGFSASPNVSAFGAQSAYNTGAYQVQSATPANPFTQMMSQQQAQQQQQQPFLSASLPANPFPRQASPFQQPFQQPIPQQQTSVFQQQTVPFQSSPSPNPFFGQQQQVQQSVFGGAPMVSSPPITSPPAMQGGMAYGQPQQTQQAADPFTSWMTQQQAPMQNGGFAGTQRWGPM